MIIQLLIFCGIFTLLVRISAIGGAINCLFFYPLKYQEIAFSRGIADKVKTQKKRQRFMLPFVTILTIVLLMFVSYDKPQDFKSAYLLSLLFLETMNWYDGFVIDRLWIGHSKFWIIPGMEDVPYVQSYKAVFTKRGKLTLIFMVLAMIPAAIVSLFNRLI